MVDSKIRKQVLRVALNQSQSIKLALRMLLLAWQYSVDTKSEPWQFAVEVSEFLRAGISKADLRWLIAKRYALSALEVTRPSDSRRQFSDLQDSVLPDNACLVLSELGLTKLLEQFSTSGISSESHKAKAQFNQNGNGRHNQASPLIVAVPCWDCSDRTLRFGDAIVKQFRSPAQNQETIILAFQESGWARRIDDPLPIAPEQDRGKRLNDTLRALNRNQVNHLLRFRGDGTGRGVRWETLAQEPGLHAI